MGCKLQWAYILISTRAKQDFIPPIQEYFSVRFRGIGGEVFFFLGWLGFGLLSFFFVGISSGLISNTLTALMASALNFHGPLLSFSFSSIIFPFSGCPNRSMAFKMSSLLSSVISWNVPRLI